MPDRFRQVWQQWQQIDVYALFGAGLGTVAAALSGTSKYDIPAIMSGLGVFVYACARSFRVWSEGYKNMQEARFMSKRLSQGYCEKLQELACHNAPDCLDRKLESDSAEG